MLLLAIGFELRLEASSSSSSAGPAIDAVVTQRECEASRLLNRCTSLAVPSDMPEHPQHLIVPQLFLVMVEPPLSPSAIWVTWFDGLQATKELLENSVTMTSP